jgi:hypothetical protein
VAPQQRATLDWYFARGVLTHVRRGEPRSGPTPESQLNRDLHPRDEYFLNDS